MYTKDIVLFLILLNFCPTFAVQDEPFNCNRYMDYALHDWSCRPYGFFRMPDSFHEDDVVTRDELLSTIGERCSNDTLKASYLNCMSTLAVKCPAQYSDVAASLLDKMNTFCDGKNVSQWIQSAVQSGYSFNTACSEVSNQAISDCAVDLSMNEETLGSNTSFATVSVIVPPLISSLVQCMKTKLALISTPEHECGSSWQDILLEFWLKMSSTGSIFINLSYEDRQVLLAVKTGSSAQNSK